MTKQEEIVGLMATSGNLFLLITLPELRRQGLTYLAFYALQRTIGEGRITEYQLRCETGLADYEMSRACALLAKSELVKIARINRDGRVRLLMPTARGRKVLRKIFQTAAERLISGISITGRIRRFKEAAELLQRASEKLHGQFQLSFFDTDLVNDPPRRRRKKRARFTKPAGAATTRK